MANHKSAIKRIRQTQRKTVRNNTIRSSCRTAIKKTRKIIELAKSDSKLKTELLESLKLTTQKLHKAESKGIFHKKNVARKISKLTKEVNAIN